MKKNRHISHTLWILRFRHRKWEHFFLVSFHCQDFWTHAEFRYVLSRWPLPYTFSRISDCISRYKIPGNKKIINRSLRNKIPVKVYIELPKCLSPIIYLLAMIKSLDGLSEFVYTDQCRIFSLRHIETLSPLQTYLKYRSSLLISPITSIKNLTRP